MFDKIKDFYKAYVEDAGILPIAFVLGVLPLIVKQKDYMTNLHMFPWYSNEQFAIDAFNYYKRNFLIAVVIFMALLMLVDFLDGSVRIKKQARLIFVALAFYEVLAVLSCVFSEYQWFSIHGTLGHFETVYVLLSYGILLLYSYCSIKNEQNVRAVFLIWGILLVPMLLLGFSQAAGHDFYTTRLGNRLIMTDAMYKSGAVVKEMFEKGRVYLTLYNPNYVGAFGALVTPLMFTLCLYAKNWRCRLFYGFITAGLLICLMGASAKTGLVALGAAFLALAVFLRKQIINRKKLLVAIIVLVTVFCTFFIIIRGENLVKEIKGAVRGFQKDTTVYNLEGIETRLDGVEVAYKGNRFLIQCEGDNSGRLGFVITDGQGQPVKMKSNEESTLYEMDDPRFEGITLRPVTLQGNLAFELNIEGKSRYFSNQTNYQGYYYYSPYGKFTTIHTAPHWGFEGYEGFATHRGYTWARTIPLLKKYLFLGSGPDTFMMVFPQNDYIIKARQGFEDMLMSKPHNMYLQIGVQTGVISLIAFLTMYAGYAVWSLKVYWKNMMAGWLPAIGAAIFAGTIGYMIVGLTADSSINVAPVFWCMLGIGMAVNHMVVKQ